MASPSQQERRQPRVPVIVAMLGAVCGAVANTLITARLGGSPWAGLAAATGGAAFGAFISTRGWFFPLRLGSGIVVTILALAFTYGGFAVADTITGQSPHLPLPSTGGNDNETGNLDSEGPLTSPSPDISRSPSLLDMGCEPGCSRSVTVFSTGTSTLKINDIEIIGPGASGLTHRGCEYTTIAPRGEHCVITVERQTASTGPATLVIHQNLPGPPTSVRLTGAGPPVPSPPPSPPPSPRPTSTSTPTTPDPSAPPP
jgi:hypothetical protein